MEQEELKKPENYTEGGGKNIRKFLVENYLQTIFTITLLIWFITSLWVSVLDVFSGNFEHKVLSYSFIIGSVTAVILQTKRMMKSRSPKPKKTKGCTKCGKK